MSKIARSALIVALASFPLCAFAQAAAGADLPREAERLGHGVVPNVGPTPGVVLATVSPAAQCSENAALAAVGQMAASDAIGACNDAITNVATTDTDRQSTLVNRGVLLMTMQQANDAKDDFDHVLAQDPMQAEALVNRGIILLAQSKGKEALADLDRGIAAGPEKPQRAYFARGQAREEVKDFSGAYADYKMAAKLDPTWAAPAAELNRFKVVSK